METLRWLSRRRPEAAQASRLPAARLAPVAAAIVLPGTDGATLGPLGLARGAGG